MSSKNALARPFIVLVLLVCALAARGSVGIAQDPQPSPEQGVVVSPDSAYAQDTLAANPPVLGSAMISIGPEAFLPWDRNATLARDSMMMIRPMTPAGTNVPLDAPLHLPHGAQVKQIVAYFFDNDATQNVTLYYVVHGHTNSMGFTADIVSSSGASNEIRYIALNNLSNYRNIDLTAYSYMIRIQMVGGANTYLNSVRVDYSYNTALPTILRP